MKQRKIVLLTGGSRGLGKNMALKLAEKDLDVIITYNSRKEDAVQVVEEIRKIGRNATALQLRSMLSLNNCLWYSKKLLKLDGSIIW